MFRRLLLNIYEAYIQSKIEYGLSIWGCTTEVKLNRVQRIQNLLARMICNNFDYIHSHGIDLVRSLKLQTIRERRDHFLSVLMFKSIHGPAPHYLSNDVTMHVDIHGYDTRSVENMDLYIPRCTQGIYKISFLYKGSSLWNTLPPWVKGSASLNDSQHNFETFKWLNTPRVYCPFYMYAYTIPCLYASILLILFTASPIHLYPELIAILSWYCCFYLWSMLMNVYICVRYSMYLTL